MPRVVKISGAQGCATLTAGAVSFLRSEAYQLRELFGGRMMLIV